MYSGLPICCLLTQRVFVDPVCVSDVTGHTFERAAIERFFDGVLKEHKQAFNPNNRALLPNRELTPNKQVKGIVDGIVDTVMKQLVRAQLAACACRG